MMHYYYVYILKSKSNPRRKYIGYTQDLDERVSAHNHGKCKSTEKYISWEIETFIAFTDKRKAMTFEKYLKTHSGRSFLKKHL